VKAKRERWGVIFNPRFVVCEADLSMASPPGGCDLDEAIKIAHRENQVLNRDRFDTNRSGDGYQPVLLPDEAE